MGLAMGLRVRLELWVRTKMGLGSKIDLGMVRVGNRGGTGNGAGNCVYVRNGTWEWRWIWGLQGEVALRLGMRLWM